MKKKAAIELSMNFLVVIIISIAIFGFGVTFIYRMVNNAKDLQGMSEKDIDRMISSLMCEDTAKVCIEEDTFALKPGDLKVLTVKVANMELVGTQPKFFVNISSSGLYLNPSNEAKPWPTSGDKEITVAPDEKTVTILKNEAKSFGFGFQIPKTGTPKGTYVYNLEVYKVTNAAGTKEKYGSTQKIYVKVI